MSNELLTLRWGENEVVLAPSVGGAVASYRSGADGRTVDWLRPTDAADIERGDQLATACFPLVPYSNRIRAGRFVFDGRDVQLRRNFGDRPHSIHGHGWQAPWTVADAGASTAILEYRHAAGPWPFDYSARQTFELAADGLTVRLELVNESEHRMPAGIGLHPYFPRTPKTRVRAGVSRIWLTDDEVMPLERVRPLGAIDPNRGVAADGVHLDNVYTGWNGRAEIEWPEYGTRLEMTADGPLVFLVLFTPQGEDFLCVEPVSHCTDAFNMAARGAQDTGMRVLEPGERLAASVRLAPKRSR